MAAPKGSALVRVIQASLKQDRVTVSYGTDVLAQQLAFGAVTSYTTVRPGTQTVTFSASGQQTAMSVTLAAGSVHTIVVLDTASGLKVDTLTDAAGSSDAPGGRGRRRLRRHGSASRARISPVAGRAGRRVAAHDRRRPRAAPVTPSALCKTDSRVQAIRACAGDPGAPSRTGLASIGLLGPCEWPVLGYGKNHSGNLDDASIKAIRCW
jgi:hypothetical protein